MYLYLRDLNLFELETVQWKGFNRPVYSTATRLYMVLLSLSLTILTIFVAFDIQSQSIIVRNPSQSTFLELNDRYSSTLSCPCRKITIPFGSFTSVTTTYHPVCNSVFVSDRWINLIFNPNISLYYPLDFRSTALGHFQLLSSLCSLARRFVNDAIDDFADATFLTQVVLSKKSLELKIQTFYSSMRISTINSLRQELELLRKVTSTNWLATALQTSCVVIFNELDQIDFVPAMIYASFLDSSNTICRCGTVWPCSSSLAGFFDIFGFSNMGSYVSSDRLIDNVTGFVAGCYPIESLLKSTLQCLFDSSCLSTILDYVSHDHSIDLTPLNSSQTKFSPQSTIDSSLDNLLVENWSDDISFEKYYEQCAPILCTYTVNQKVSFLYIIAQLLGFYGGLTIVLRLLIPRIVSRFFNYHRSQAQPVNENQTPIWQRIQQEVMELNLFRTREEQHDIYELQTSRLATRIFFILTFLCVLVLSIYTTVMIRTQTIVIADPSETAFRDLHSKYSSTLKCPCDRIAVEYGTFINLSPRYHSVCSSEFISSAWINSLSPLNWIEELFEENDFRAYGQIFFNALLTLCNLIELMVFNSWFVFKQSFMITEQVLPDTQLIARSTDALNRFKSDVLTEFTRVLLIIQFQTSTLFPIASENYGFMPLILTNSTEPIEIYTRSLTHSNCSCALNDLCSASVGFYNSSIYANALIKESRYNVPQLFIGCFVIQAALQSSLQCFFNQTCLDIIQSEIVSPNSINISILQSNHSRFQPETLVGDLVNELMIEDWGESINYSKYYAQCQPKQCLYPVNSRDSISLIIAKIIALCGGVIAALKIIVPIIVRFLRQQCRPKLDINLPNDQLLTSMSYFGQALRSMRTKLSDFNLFETELSWNHPERQYHEIISTRIHFLLLTITVSIMIFYTAFSMKTQTIIIDYPSESILDQIRSNNEYLSTLRCPCQSISIPYQSFTSISFGLHQLCSSDFIRADSPWTNLLNIAMTSGRYKYDDYRNFGLLHFRLLSSLCQLANDVITDAVKRFNGNELITGQVEFREFFITKTCNALNQLQKSTARQFVRTLDFTRSLTQGNGIISATLSNWRYRLIDRTHLSTIWTFPRSYDYPSNCSCATSSMCTSLATINNIVVPGFRVGCYALDSLLQSTLECLYDRNCLTMIQSLSSSMNFTITPLNSNLSSPNSTVQSLIDELLIAEWNTNVSYEKYYESCAPLFCSYSINQRADLIYIVTASIGFYGGLSTAIRIIAPMMAKIGQSIWMFYQTKHVRQNMIFPNND